jgi:hypothetical protein
MTRKRSLPLAPAQTGLGLPTIMDRDLVAAHGVKYVHLAVFAIDIDRVYWLEPEHPTLPFGWEVFLTEWFLLAHDPELEQERCDLLAAICGTLLDESPGEPPLGGQIVFAIYDAVKRGALPEQLATLFSNWRNPPRELVTQLATLHARGADNARSLANHCLSVDIEPPLAPPTRETLQRIVSGEVEPTAATRGT